MKNVMIKVAKVSLQVVAGLAMVVMMMFAFSVKTDSVEDMAPELMEQYQVDSFEELMNYGHENNN